MRHVPLSEPTYTVEATIKKALKMRVEAMTLRAKRVEKRIEEEHARALRNDPSLS